MTEIYLIRHTQAEGNLYRMMQGQWDGDVTELGLKQIDALAERFKDIHIDAVYSSDLYRAWKTATAVTRYNGLEIIKTPLLREINMGTWEALFFGNTWHEHPEMAHKFVFDSDNWIVEGAETFQDVKDRVYPELVRIAEAHDGQRVAVVSHGVAIRCFLSVVLDKPLSDVNALPICRNTSVSKFTYDNGQFTLEYLNDSSHIDSLVVPEWNKNHDLRDESFNPADDSRWYIGCYEDAWQAARGSLSGFNGNTYYCSAIKHHSADRNAVLKIYDKEAAVGLIDLDTSRGADENFGWITLLYLIPEYRNLGYGIQLLARAMFHYEKMGRDALRLTVNLNNAPALRFYEKSGFKEIDREIRSGNTIILMEKKLGGRIDVQSTGEN